MKYYYTLLARHNKADRYANGIAIFNIGMGDVEMFPELLQIDQLWILKSGAIQTIHIKAIAGGRN